jgi:hypothetical protein
MILPMLVDLSLLAISWKKSCVNSFVYAVCLGGCLFAPFAVPCFGGTEDFSQLKVLWNGAGTREVLKTWSPAELSAQFKRTTSREKDPETGKLVSWQGILLSQLVDKALEQLPPERKAQVDLLIMKGENGVMAHIPRSLITKYPLLLARSPVPVSVIVPWTSKPKIRTEGLPLERYFVSGVREVELTSYRERFASFFLKRRTDPAAVRGEKIFIQNCVTCQDEGLDGNAAEREIASDRHASLEATLSERDRRALRSYLNAWRAEKAAASSNLTSAVRQL